MSRRLATIGANSTNYASGGSTANVIPKGNGSSALQDSSITDNGTAISSAEYIVLGPATASFSALSQTYLSKTYNRAGQLNTSTASVQWALLGHFQDNTTNAITGTLGVAVASHTSGTKASVTGLEGDAYADGSGGTVSSLYGVNVYNQQSSGATVTTHAAYSSYQQVNSGATAATSIYGFNMTGINLDAAITVTRAAGIRIDAITKSAGTITDVYGLDIASLTAGATNYAIRTGSGRVSLGDKITTYNAIATTGWGVPSIYGTGRSTAQTGAVATVATYTVGAADGSFIVSANVLVTTSTNHNFTVTCAYADEGNTARTLTFNFSSLAGALATAIANAGGAVPYEGVPMHIRCKAATAITIATTGTFTTVTYNVEGSISQIA